MEVFREYTSVRQNVESKIKIKLDKSFWGVGRTKRIINIIDDEFTNLEKPLDEKRLYQKLKKNVKGKEFTDYDFKRIARTEVKRYEVINFLLDLQSQGYLWVKQQSERTACKLCKSYNGRKFRITYLLSNAGNKDNIPHHPNCRDIYKKVK